jgi:hypothetical protein
VVHIPFSDTGDGWGALGYSATIPKIDAANSLASLLGAQIGKTVNPAYVAYGIQSGNITVGGSDEGQDEIPILYIPKPPGEAALEPLITQIDLPGALALLDAQLADIARDLPELRMSEAMRSGLSGEALARVLRRCCQDQRSARQPRQRASPCAPNGDCHCRREWLRSRVSWL